MLCELRAASTRMDIKGEIRTFLCMINLAIDRIGAADACVGVGLVGEGGRRAMRSSVREGRLEGATSDGQLRSTSHKGGGLKTQQRAYWKPQELVEASAQ